MKSIIKDLELVDGRTLYVQISEGGKVSLSFDGSDTSVQVSLSFEELHQYEGIIIDAVSERTRQLKAELAA